MMSLQGVLLPKQSPRYIGGCSPAPLALPARGAGVAKTARNDMETRKK
jgi:hypothetical protein